MINFHIISIFPEIFENYFKVGILGRAQKKGIIKINLYNLRDFTSDKHQTIDDTPYGGGPGMVLKIEPIFKCVKQIKNQIRKEKKDNQMIKLFQESSKKNEIRTVLLSARGRIFNQKLAKKMAEIKDILLICGRYEGVDQRVAEKIADEEISVGKFVLSGGELAAMIMVDVISRLIPGVLGNPQSLEKESYQIGLNSLDYPVYTKPAVFKGWKVPEVLLKGNHKEIEKWREQFIQRNR